MTKTPRLLRLMPCLLLPVLTSCATPAPISPPSSSAIVVDTAAEVKAAACVALKPDVLTAEEEKDAVLLNYSAREAASWLAFGCKA
jgi:hypothetical protein